MENGCEFDAIDASQSHQTRKHPCKRMRVVGMSIFEFDREKYDDMVREEGAYNKAVSTARNLLAMGLLSVEQIAQAINLPLSEVAAL